MDWNVQYFDQVEAWLDDLGSSQLKSVAKELYLIERCGSWLRLPHSKSLGAGLFELRERRFGLRIYYCFGQKNTVVLLHAGNKNSQKNDIKIARQLLTTLRSELS